MLSECLCPFYTLDRKNVGQLVCLQQFSEFLQVILTSDGRLGLTFAVNIHDAPQHDY